MAELMARLSRHDERLLLAVVASRRPVLDRLLRALTHLGGATVTIAAALLLLLSGDVALADAGARAAFALAGSHLVVQALKRIAARPRPHLPVGMESLVRAPDRFSFPSGHAAASLSVGLALSSVASPVLAVPLLGLTLTVGISRCYLGVHYPGDVVAGWLLALLGTIAAGPVLGVVGLGA